MRVGSVIVTGRNRGGCQSVVMVRDEAELYLQVGAALEGEGGLGERDYSHRNWEIHWPGQVCALMVATLLYL